MSTWPSSPSVPVREAPPRAERSTVTLDTPQLARLKSALDAIPNTGTKELSYDQWFRVVCAIHFATDGSDEGFALADEFSARSAKHNAEFFAHRVWQYVRGERAGEVVTERSLFAMAAEHGWLDESIADDFAVIAAEPDHHGTGQRFTFLPASQFTAGKATAWIVKGVIPQAGLIVVYGESGSGKSFLALDVVGAVVRGVEWRGKRTAQCRVGYIAAEGAGGFRNRVTAYQIHNGIEAGAFDDLVVLADAPNFMEAKDIIDLGNAIRAAGPLGMVVVDTLAQVTPGANENAGEDMGRVIGHCRTLHQVTGATIVLIHHSGKDASRGARGWSGLRAAADAELEITRAEHDRVATVTKMKDSEEGEEFGFKLAVVPVTMDEDGEVVSSCVVEHGAAVVKDKQRRAPKGVMEKRVWQAAIDAQGVDGTPPAVSDVIDAAVALTPFDQAAGKRDVRRQHALRALDSLVDGHKLVVADGRVKLPGRG